MPDLLAVAREIKQLEGADGGGIELVEQPQPRELADGVWQRVDTDAELADRIGLLVQLGILRLANFAIGAQIGVTDQLGQRAQPLRELAIDADGGDLELAGASRPVDAADLGVEVERPLRRLQNALLVRVRLGGGRDHEPEPRAAGDLGDDAVGVGVAAGVRRGHDEAGATRPGGDVRARGRGGAIHGLRRTAVEDQHGRGHASEAPGPPPARGHRPPGARARARSRPRA